MWYENDATNTSVLDFPIFTLSFDSPLPNGDKAAAPDTLYYLRNRRIWFKMVEDTPDAPAIAITAGAAQPGRGDNDRQRRR